MLEELGDEPFFTLVDYGELWPNASLAHLSKIQARRGGYETDMVRRVEEAWDAALQTLTCEQVRLLLSQQMGLEWLAHPIVEFVSRYPDAHITNYSGEMSLLSLKAADALAAVAGLSFHLWLRQDFQWLNRALSWDEEMLRKTMVDLATARRVAGVSTG